MSCRKELSVEEVRKYQLQILDFVHEFCEANGLQYFLIAGTLLGAVRHKGYIPWDDDIDLAMKREDYDKFVRSFSKEGCYVESVENNSSCAIPFAKVCMENTEVVELSHLITKPYGINIDIFPIDHVPENLNKQKKLFRKIKLYNVLLCLKSTVIVKERSKIKNMILGISQFFMSGVSGYKIVNKIVQTAQLYNNTETSMCAEIVWGCGAKEIVSQWAFSKSVLMDFENKKYFVPAGWDEWLKNRYGDYMKLPPKEQQITHHENKVYVLEQD